MGLDVNIPLAVVDRWATALKSAAGRDQRLSQADRAAAQTAHPPDAVGLDHFITAARGVSGGTVTAADLDAVAAAARAALTSGAGSNLVLSQAERSRLPLLARLASASAAGTTLRPSVDVARGWADGRNFGGIWRSTLETNRDAASLPSTVKDAVRTWKQWEDADLGSVSVYAVKNTLPGLLAVHTTTDGDDGHLEIYDEEGRALLSGTTTISADASGRLQHGVTWDRSFGAVRAALTQLQPSPGQTFQSRFDDAFRAATGAAISPEVTAVSETTHIDLDLRLGAATAKARLDRVGGRDQLTVLQVNQNGPVQSAGMLAQLQAALRADPRFPDATVVAAGQRSTLTEQFHTVLFTSGGVERTARIEPQGAVTVGRVDDANVAREIAVALATAEAIRRAQQTGPLAHLEVLARTFNGGARLAVDEPAPANRRGFDAARDHKQLIVRDLLGSAAAVVTFTKSGGHRLDWI